jgi:hypothetical protein
MKWITGTQGSNWITRKALLSLAISVMVVFSLAGSVSAHTPLLYIEDNQDGTIYAEAGFSTGASAAGMPCRLVDEDDNILWEGEFGEDSTLIIQKPDVDPYFVVFDGGPGHVVTKPGPPLTAEEREALGIEEKTEEPAEPAAVRGIQEVVEELVEHVNDLIEASTALRDNTGEIADDESLDDSLRAKAEEIRAVSRELGNIAEVIREHVDELEGLVSDPEANKAEIKETLDEVVDRLEECYAILEAKCDLVHAVLAITPESHKEYADATHDVYHEAERLIKQLTEHAQELAGLVGVAIPESAIKPVAVPEQYIQMYDLLVLSAEEVAIEAHGHLCVCGATAFRVTQVAFLELWGEEIPAKGELEVTYLHPGRGHKDVFEYLLGPENVTYVKAGDPKHLTLEDHFVYTFTRTDTGVTWETTMKEGVIPEGFFDLRYEVKGFLKGWHQERPTEAKKAAFKQQFDEAVYNILSMEASQIFEGVTP